MRSVSVVIPAYNAAAFVLEALDSVFAQGLDAPEIVVVDDGSSDGTADVVRSYGRGVRVLAQERSGSGRARNRGLAETSGAFVAFLDADDVWTAGKSERQLPLLEARPDAGLVFSDMVAVENGVRATRTYFEERGFLGNSTPAAIFLHDMISTPTVIVRRRCLEEAGGFDESLPIGQDTDLWFRLALRWPVEVVRAPLVERRLHGGNVTRNHRLLARCVVEIWGRHLDACVAHEPARAAELRAYYRRKRWEHEFVEGCALLHERRPEDARAAFRRAIALAPGAPRPYVFYLASWFGWPFARRGVAE